MLSPQTTPVLLGNSVAVHGAVSELELVTSAQNARGCVVTSGSISVVSTGVGRIIMRNAAGTVSVNLMELAPVGNPASAVMPYPVEIPPGWRLLVSNANVPGSVQVTYRLK